MQAQNGNRITNAHDLRTHPSCMRPAAILFGLMLSMVATPASAAELSAAQIRELLIKKSIAEHGGSCPCPYNVDRAGRRCGARSAYSKPGGDAPLCFASDVSDEMVARYRGR